MDLSKSTFQDLKEIRRILERDTIRMAAERRTTDDLVALNDAARNYKAKVLEGKIAIDEDLLFHLKIADAAKNPVLKSLLLKVASQILKYCLTQEFDSVDVQHYPQKTTEHQLIVEYITERRTDLAVKTMELHLT